MKNSLDQVASPDLYLYTKDEQGKSAKVLEEKTQTERKKKIGDCSKDNDNAAKYAQTILLPEIWEHILDHITEIQDIQSCLNVCKLWNNEIVRKRLFSLYTTVFPKVASYLDSHSIKQIRRTCKNWKKVMDRLLESSSKSFLPHEGFKYQMALNKIEAIDRFQKEMDRFPFINPFPTRRLELTEFQMANRELYWSKFEKVLKRFGKEFYSFEFQTLGSTNAHFGQSLQRHLPLLPNLRKCRLTLLFAPAPVEDIILPTLDHLEELSLYIVDKGLFRAMITSYGHQIKKLAVPQCLLKDSFEWNRDMPLLEHLKITLFEETYPEPCEIHVGQWKLKSLVCNVIHNDIRSLQTLLQISYETLVDLKIMFVSEMEDDIPKILWTSVELPKQLEKLKLNYYDGPFDFLMGMDNLKHLHIHKTTSGMVLEDATKDKLEITGFEHRMYESNLWEMLPNLETVTIAKFEETGQEPFNVIEVKGHYRRQMKNFIQNMEDKGQANR